MNLKLDLPYYQILKNALVFLRSGGKEIDYHRRGKIAAI